MNDNLNYVNELAIVIPAYKDLYLNETLLSILNQTCKKFKLYIFDDASPSNILQIVKPYLNSSQLNISFHRFDTNLGGHDLVSHWNRCINMIDNSRWVWLFSDDDLMHPKCVEDFWKKVNEFPNHELFHLDVEIIDKNSTVYRVPLRFPETLSTADYFFKRINFEIESFVVEFIFDRVLFNDYNGFENFDLAWSSDDSAWIKFSRRGIVNINTEARVYWRYSGENISSLTEDKSIILRKLFSNMNYIKWQKQYFYDKEIVDKCSNFSKFRWVFQLVKVSKKFSSIEKYKLSILFFNKYLSSKKGMFSCFIYLFLWHLKQKLSLK